MFKRLTARHALRVLLLSSAFFLPSCGGGGSETASGSTQPVTISPPQSIIAPPADTAKPAPALDASTLSPDPSAATVTIDATADPAGLFTRDTPFLAGVGTHFALSTTRGYELAGARAAMQDIGFDSFRDDIYWNDFAPAYDLTGSYLNKRLGDFVQNSGSRPFLILNNGHPLIPDAMPPLTDAARAAFAAFALRAVNATAGRDAIYELWNEWNLRGAGSIFGNIPMVGAGDGRDPRSASHYAALAHTVVDTLKAKNPATTVVVGGTADDPDWTWTKAVISTGIMQKADGYSVHLYAHCNIDPWRGAAHLISYLESLQVAASSANGGKTVPIYISEFSWPTSAHKCGLAPQVAADYASQFMLYAAAKPWVRGAWFYELLDGGTDTMDIEQNFGLYYAGYRAKPSACQMRETIALIKSATAMGVEQPKKGLFVVKIRTAQGIKAVVWTRLSSESGTLRLGGDAPFTARRLCDGVSAAGADRTVAVGLTPVVVSIDGVDRAAMQIKGN